MHMDKGDRFVPLYNCDMLARSLGQIVVARYRCILCLYTSILVYWF